jgi:hypothetical protein
VRTAHIFMAEYRQCYPEAIAVLAEGIEDSLKFSLQHDHMAA